MRKKKTKTLKKVIKPFKTEGQKLYLKYHKLCTSNPNDLEGYKMSYQDSQKIIENIKTKKKANRLLSEMNKVIAFENVSGNVPYERAYLNLKDMILFKIEKLDEIEEYKKNIL